MKIDSFHSLYANRSVYLHLTCFTGLSFMMFSGLMMAKLNTLKNFFMLVRYGRFVNLSTLLCISFTRVFVREKMQMIEFALQKIFAIATNKGVNQSTILHSLG